MFTSFSEAERAIRFQKDRRMFIGINPSALVIIVVFSFLYRGTNPHISIRRQSLKMLIKGQKLVNYR
jgi:hypothetical protein